LSFAILPAVVYILCMATSVTCAVLLARTYARTRSRLLLWTSLSFGLLAINNLFLVLDMLVLRQIDFQPVRAVTFIGALLVLLYGFIWEVD
jgi:hypothetical protein